MARSSKKPQRTKRAPVVTTPSDQKVIVGICVALIVMVWLVFGQTLRHQFINYDDSAYILNNAPVARGLTVNGIAWAFTSIHSSNWHPLTWISHMIDCQIFGFRAGGHHFTNVLLHSVGTVLLFFLLRQLTGNVWASAFVAALFATHPLRVESVAWVAERKDLLSGIFFMLTTAAYVRYVRAPARGHYGWVVLLFSLGLMCKPMLVSLPIVLLLLDYWPLERFDKQKKAGRTTFQALRALTIEKLPLFGLVLLSCVITIIAQRGSIRSIAKISLPVRLENALVSAVDYLWQIFWPANLTLLYPLDPTRLGVIRVVGSAMVLIGISVAVLLLRRRRYLVTGWLWYLVMLIPVIGILQVGEQSRADRYTYLPHIGIYLMLTWAMLDFSANWSKRRMAFTAFVTVALIGLICVSYVQAGYWRDSETLWSRSLACTNNNTTAEVLLAETYHTQGKMSEAMDHLQKALEIEPRQYQVHSTLGVFYLEMGRADKSLEHLRTALEIDPNFGDAQYNIGNTLVEMGRAKEAVAHYSKAIELNPNDIEASNSMAWILATSPDGNLRDGAKATELAAHADSLSGHRSQSVMATLAAAYAETGRFSDAIQTAQRALNLAMAERNNPEANLIRTEIETYRSNRPFRDQRNSGQSR